MKKIIVITGPQGSGKTTLARIIAETHDVIEHMLADDLFNYLNGREVITPADVRIVDELTAKDIICVKELCSPSNKPIGTLILVTNDNIEKEPLNSMFEVVELKS